MAPNNPDSNAIRFISEPGHHRPRIRRCLLLLGGGVILAGVGTFLIANGLPDYSVRRAQLTVQLIPLALGVFSLIFGVVGLISGLMGFARSGSAATDLIVDRGGLTIRDRRLLPWATIKEVTSIEYVNEAKIQLLWDKSELHRALLVKVVNASNPASEDIGTGESQVKVSLLRYPARDYAKNYQAVLDQFSRRKIVVKHEKKWKQT